MSYLSFKVSGTIVSLIVIQRHHSSQPSAGQLVVQSHVKQRRIACDSGIFGYVTRPFGLATPDPIIVLAISDIHYFDQGPAQHRGQVASKMDWNCMSYLSCKVSGTIVSLIVIQRHHSR
jgi:hypothetical protein